MTNRVIKFRAWDTFNERMIMEPYLFRPSTDSDKLEEDEKFNTPFIYYEDWRDVEDGISRPCYIMQFTGLTDKEGIEIYEGDRVRIRRHLTEGKDYIDYNCDVKFGTYCYCLFIADKQMWPLDPITAREVEVIGNIHQTDHQNPELIK